MHRSHRLLPIVVTFAAANLVPTPLAAQVPPSPAMPWSALLGGSGFEHPEPYDAMTIAANGDVLLCGLTTSGDFPRTTGPAYQGMEDAFVARIRDGVVVWSILLGGSGRDGARAIVEDGHGDIWVAGRTSSANFLATWPYPMPAGAPQATYGGGTTDYGDGFLVRLGNALATPAPTYATYLGGSGDDVVSTMILCQNGTRLALGGWTASTNLPLAGAPFQPTHGSTLPPASGQLGADGFVALFDATTGALTNTTYVGGGSDDLVIDLAEVLFSAPSDGVQTPIVPSLVATGRTMSTNFPVTPSTALDTTLGGLQDVFLVMFDSVLNQQLYGSYLGGSGNDVPYSLCRVPRRDLWMPSDIWVAGQTTSTNFPTSPGCLQPAFGGGGTAFGTDGFIAHVDLGVFAPSTLLFATYLGGPGDDSIMEIEADRSGFVDAVGLAGSPPWSHTTAGALQPVFQGGGAAPVGPTDGFVVRLDPAQSGTAQRVYGTFLGGSQGWENVMDVALRGNGNAVVVGWTHSANFPRTTGATHQGNSDVFVSELSLLPSPVQRYGAPSPAGTRLHLAVNSQPSPGNSQFEVHVHDAPPQLPGVLFFGTPATAAIQVPGLGIDALLLTIPVGLPAIADQNGFARLPVPIPSAYTWGGHGLQAVWLDPASSQPFQASDALR